MNKNKLVSIIGLLVIVTAFIAYGLFGGHKSPSKSSSFGAVNPDTTTMPIGHFIKTTLLNATTTTATSTTQDTNKFVRIAGAKKVDLYFSRAWGAGNSGSSRFSVQVTPDGDNWYDFNKLVQNSATSTVPTTLGSVTISAATSTTVVSMDLQYDAFYAVRCVVWETTDGTHSCDVTAEY